MSSPGADDAGLAARTLNDVVALSMLPAVWLGAEPVRIAESLAAAVFTIVDADFVCVCVEGDADHRRICVAQVERNGTDAALAAALAPVLLAWARAHDPDDLMPLESSRGRGRLCVTARPLAVNAEYGVIAAGFLAPRTPTPIQHLLLNVAASQATTTIDNVRLLRSLRRHATQLSGLTEATGAMLTRSASLEAALGIITERARVLVGVHQAVTVTAGVDGQGPVTAVALSNADGDAPASERQGFAIYPDLAPGRGDGIVRMTHAELEAQPAWRRLADRSAPRPMRGLLAAPLVGRNGSAFGFIQLSDKHEGEFTAQDEGILLQLAGFAALIIEQRVAEAAQQAAMKEAEAARADAEAASRAKDEFLAMLGHELRNPLAPIQTALQLMRLRGDETAERERTVIERQVRHLTRLVDDLLDVSRIAQGKIELKRERLNIAEVVAKAIEMASPLVEQRRHTLEVRVPRAGLEVEGDPLRLAQAVSNLLANAAKYTEPGGSIEIAADREDGDIVLTVRDSGVGIAPDMLPRIFEMFVQGRQSLERSQGGLGLGLTIVRSLVALHGGTVTARSGGIGRGSEFTVRLPARQPRAEPSAVSGVPAPEPALTREAASALRVLVVDDNEDAADMLVSALSSLGYLTRAAHDGPAALRAYAAFSPDVALLDLGLPVMDGYELARQLLRVAAGRVHLIAVTGYGQAADRMRSQAAGFDHHLVKPIDLLVLERLLHDFERSRRPAPPPDSLN